MKNNLLIVLMLLIIGVGCKHAINPNAKINSEKHIDDVIKGNNEFEKTVYNVIRWYNDKNQDSLNSLIDDKTGLYLIYRRGTHDAENNLNKICLSSNCIYEENIPDWVQESIKKQKIKIDYTISYENYPTFQNCEVASKDGLYIDTLKVDRFLTETIKNYKTVYAPESLYTDLEIKILIEKASKVENNSRKIILTKNQGGYYSGHFIFYLTKFDDKWYLTIIDFASLDCSV